MTESVISHDAVPSGLCINIPQVGFLLAIGTEFSDSEEWNPHSARIQQHERSTVTIVAPSGGGHI